MEINLQYCHQQQLRFVSKKEALLAIDAAQPRSALSIQERLAVKAVLKAFLNFDKYTRRAFWILTFMFGGLLGRYLDWP